MAKKKTASKKAKAQTTEPELPALPESELQTAAGGKGAAGGFKPFTGGGTKGWSSMAPLLKNGVKALEVAGAAATAGTFIAQLMPPKK